MKQIDSMLPCLFCDRSQKKLKCGKNISDTHGYCLGCQSLILTIFWTHLSSGTDQMHGNMESILFSRWPLKKDTDSIPLSMSLCRRSPINQNTRKLCVGDWVCIDYFSFISTSGYPNQRKKWFLSIFRTKNCYFPWFCFVVMNVNFFGPQSEYIVSGSDCGHIFLWDKQTEEVVQFLQGDNTRTVSSMVIWMCMILAHLSAQL